MKRVICVLVVIMCCGFCAADDKVKSESSYTTVKDISYILDQTDNVDEYAKERCKLDIYYPEGKDAFTTVVWLHSGGLTAGEKCVPDELKGKGIAVVGVNYRLSPKVKSPVYVEDAAQAIAWVFKNISEYGGDPEKIIVSGFSAGGYLTSLIGLDKRYLARYGIDANDIAGLAALSGHAITHFTVREEMGIDGKQPVIDEMSPLFYVRGDAPPLLLVTGDRELEVLGRYEENAYLMRMMRIAGHTKTEIYELDGYGHERKPALPLLIKFINRELKPVM
ncbi:MAG: alpha/beta hydrolase [Sedimentisphaeraceae bacterium JB056]